MTSINLLHPLYNVADIRKIEQAALAALPPGTLMQRAGAAAAGVALTLIPENHADLEVLVLAGPGNNGGDALEVAHRLANAGMRVTVLLEIVPSVQALDAQQALQRAQASPARFTDCSSLPDLTTRNWALVVDGLFGIGLARPLEGGWRQIIEAVNALDCPVLALDVPSGLDADTGNVVGPAGVAVYASHTVTFIGDKPGLHTADGRDHAGTVSVAALEIEQDHFVTARIQLAGIESFKDCLSRRRQNSHKGSYGDLAVLGGAHGMGGAPVLAARAAAKCGAGRVFAVFLGEAPLYDSAQAELMCRRADEYDYSKATVVAGPGMGSERSARDLLADVLLLGAPLVLDADALNLIAADSELQRRLQDRDALPAVLTPHPLEAARLLATSSSVVQSDRLAAAQELAARFKSVVVLKGSGTVIAHPDGILAINPSGNPALATAGSGDVLAGVCGALLAQHWPAWEAALAAVWMHGRAADLLVAQGIGPIGLTAGELIPVIRTILNQLTEQHAAHRTPG